MANTTLWHLVGQIYCSLAAQSQVITEATLLNEAEFDTALKGANEGLFRAYRRCPAVQRKIVRALLGEQKPFNLRKYIIERDLMPDLPIVIRVGLDPNFLTELCQKYGPALVESSIRYAYSKDGYEKAIKDGKSLNESSEEFRELAHREIATIGLDEAATITKDEIEKFKNTVTALTFGSDKEASLRYKSILQKLDTWEKEAEQTKMSNIQKEIANQDKIIKKAQEEKAKNAALATSQVNEIRNEIQQLKLGVIQKLVARSLLVPDLQYLKSEALKHADFAQMFSDNTIIGTIKDVITSAIREDFKLISSTASVALAAHINDLKVLLDQSFSSKYLGDAGTAPTPAAGNIIGAFSKKEQQQQQKGQPPQPSQKGIDRGMAEAFTRVAVRKLYDLYVNNIEKVLNVCVTFKLGEVFSAGGASGKTSEINVMPQISGSLSELSKALNNLKALSDFGKESETATLEGIPSGNERKANLEKIIGSLELTADFPVDKNPQDLLKDQAAAAEFRSKVGSKIGFPSLDGIYRAILNAGHYVLATSGQYRIPGYIDLSLEKGDIAYLKTNFLNVKIEYLTLSKDEFISRVNASNVAQETLDKIDDKWIDAYNGSLRRVGIEPFINAIHELFAEPIAQLISELYPPLGPEGVTIIYVLRLSQASGTDTITARLDKVRKYSATISNIAQKNFNAMIRPVALKNMPEAASLQNIVNSRAHLKLDISSPGVVVSSSNRLSYYNVYTNILESEHYPDMEVLLEAEQAAPWFNKARKTINVLIYGLPILAVSALDKLIGTLSGVFGWVGLKLYSYFGWKRLEATENPYRKAMIEYYKLRRNKDPRAQRISILIEVGSQDRAIVDYLSVGKEREAFNHLKTLGEMLVLPQEGDKNVPKYSFDNEDYDLAIKCIIGKEKMWKAIASAKQKLSDAETTINRITSDINYNNPELSLLHLWLTASRWFIINGAVRQAASVLARYGIITTTFREVAKSKSVPMVGSVVAVRTSDKEYPIYTFPYTNKTPREYPELVREKDTSGSVLQGKIQAGLSYELVFMDMFSDLKCNWCIRYVGTKDPKFVRLTPIQQIQYYYLPLEDFEYLTGRVFEFPSNNDIEAPKNEIGDKDPDKALQASIAVMATETFIDKFFGSGKANVYTYQPAPGVSAPEPEEEPKPDLSGIKPKASILPPISPVPTPAVRPTPKQEPSPGAGEGETEEEAGAKEIKSLKGHVAERFPLPLEISIPGTKITESTMGWLKRKKIMPASEYYSSLRATGDWIKTHLDDAEFASIINRIGIMGDNFFLYEEKGYFFDFLQICTLLQAKMEKYPTPPSTLQTLMVSPAIADKSLEVNKALTKLYSLLYGLAFSLRALSAFLLYDKSAGEYPGSTDTPRYETLIPPLDTEVKTILTNLEVYSKAIEAAKEPTEAAVKDVMSLDLSTLFMGFVFSLDPSILNKFPAIPGYGKLSADETTSRITYNLGLPGLRKTFESLEKDMLCSLCEQDEAKQAQSGSTAEPVDTAPKPASNVPSEPKEKPTENVPPTDKKVTKEEGGTDEIQLSNGKSISKEEAKQMLGKLLGNIATQLTQGTEEAKPETKPEEAPAEAEKKPEEAHPEETKEMASDESNALEPPKTESVDAILSSRIIRLLGLKRSAEKGHTAVGTPTLKLSEYLALKNLAELREWNENLAGVSQSVAESPLHPLATTMLESNSILCDIAAGNLVKALDEVLDLPEAYLYDACEIGFALAQAANTRTTGKYLLESEDYEQVGAMLSYIKENRLYEADAGDYLKRKYSAYGAESEKMATGFKKSKSELESKLKKSKLGKPLAYRQKLNREFKDNLERLQKQQEVGAYRLLQKYQRQWEGDKTAKKDKRVVKTVKEEFEVINTPIMPETSIPAITSPVPMPDATVASTALGTMTGSNMVMAANQIAGVQNAVPLPDAKATLTKDVTFTKYIVNRDIAGSLLRAKELLPNESEDRLVTLIQEIENEEVPKPEVPGAVDNVLKNQILAVPPVEEPVVPPTAETPEVPVEAKAEPTPEYPTAPEGAPMAAEVNYNVPEAQMSTEYEGLLIKKDPILCEVATSAGVKKVPAGQIRILPFGSDLNSSLTQVKNGVDLTEVARRRLYSFSLAVPYREIEKVLEMPKVMERYLAVYAPKWDDRIMEAVNLSGGYVSEGVAVIPIGSLEAGDQARVRSLLEKTRSYKVAVMNPIRSNPNISIFEQLEVASGSEGDAIASAFTDGMGALKSAQDAVIDFQGYLGKINSLIGLTNRGKRIQNRIEKLTAATKEMAGTIKDTMEELSQDHDAFEKEFPDATAPAPEEVPAEPESEKPVEPSSEPPKAEPAPEKPPAPAPAPEEKKTENLSRVMSTVKRIVEKYDFPAIFENKRIDRIPKIVLTECHDLTPKEVSQVAKELKKLYAEY